MSSEHKLNWAKKPALAIIGIVILFFALIVGFDEPVTETVASDTTAERVKDDDVAASANENKISDMSLYFDCKPKIQEQLISPRSFDPSALSVKYDFLDNQHIIRFDFYATNAQGGEVMQQAICSFDEDGNILDYGLI